MSLWLILDGRHDQLLLLVGWHHRLEISQLILGLRLQCLLKIGVQVVNHVSFLDSQIVQAFLQLLLLLCHRLRLFQISGQLHLQISVVVVLSNRTSMLRELRHESAIHIIVFISSSRCWCCLFGLLLAGLSWRICNLLLKVFDLVLELLIVV